MARLYAPERGHIVWLSFSPTKGHEQAGRRPALILSPAAYNRKTGLALACPITNQVKGYPFEVAVPEGLPVTGVVLADSVRNLDWRERQCVRVCHVPTELVETVVKKLSVLLAG